MKREEAQAFGQELQRLRKERGVSLEEISRETKIRKVVLEAFEQGRFEELPPEVFAAGFLKAYAQRLGTPPDPLVKRFQRILHPPAPLQPPEARREGRRVLPWILLLAFVLLCAAAGTWLALRPGRTSPAEGAAPAPEAPPVLPEPLPPAAARPAEPPGAAAPPAESPPPAPAPSPSAAPLPVPKETPAAAPVPEGDLVIRASGPCWVELWSGEKRLLRRELAAGETVAFSGERFRADFGDSGAVTVAFRGRAVKLEGAPGKVLKGVEIPPPAGEAAP